MYQGILGQVLGPILVAFSLHAWMQWKIEGREKQIDLDYLKRSWKTERWTFPAMSLTQLLLLSSVQSSIMTTISSHNGWVGQNRSVFHKPLNLPRSTLAIANLGKLGDGVI